jgi:thioredoxin 1
MKALYFTAVWCAACKTTTPIVLKLKKEGFNIEKVDVDSFKEKAKQYNIKALPTLVILDGDKEVKRLVGKFTEANVREAMTRTDPDYNIW